MYRYLNLRAPTGVLRFDVGGCISNIDFLLIGDPLIESVKVEDNGEPLVDLLLHSPELSFDLTRQNVQKKSSSIAFARENVARMLVDAQNVLPFGYKLLLKECYRPLSVQLDFWNHYELFLRNKFPNWSEREVRLECSKFVAPVSVAPHSTGGAVDLLLTDVEGRWLDMGSEFNAEPSECEYRTYFYSDKISEKAREYRRILGAAMTEVGFINYPTEWWHWSYGDKYWAHRTGARCAVYASVDTLNP